MTTWTRPMVMALVAVISAATAVCAQGPPGAVDAARKAAETWLALVDRGQYARSWDEASSLFRNAVEKAAWLKSVQEARKPLGALKSRKLRGAQTTTSLPGAPPGDYVVIQYDASFEGRPAAVETITPMLEADGKWRVSGYYVR